MVTTAREFLSPSEVIDLLRFETQIIQSYRERLAKLRNDAGIASGISCEPIQSGKVGDPVLWAVCEIDRLEQEKREHVNRIWEYLVYLETPLQRNVFKARYIYGMRFDKVALRLKYSESHVKKAHGRGLILIAEKVSTLRNGLHDT